MYPAPASHHVFTAMSACLASVLDGAGIDSTTFDADNHAAGFAVGHICGITLATAPAGTYHYLATPVIGDPAVPAGTYNSLLVTPANGGLSRVEDFDPAIHRAAINEPGSFSGNITLAAHLARHCGVTLTDPVRSGAHLESVALVAAGKVQLAAIDRMSLKLAGQDRPEAVAKIRVIGETDFHPAPPFVADGALSAGLVRELRDALLDFRRLPEFAELERLVGMTDIIVIDEARYPTMAMIGR